MGGWDNASYVECAKDATLLDALAELFGAFGYLRANPPSRARVRSLTGKDWSDNVLGAPHLLIGYRRMNDDWVKLHCHPHYLLCADVAGEMLLERLCRHLSCAALHINVYDGHAVAVVAVDGNGQATISGTTYDSLDDLCQRYGARMWEMTENVTFEFHGAQRVFKSLEQCFDFPPRFKGFDRGNDCDLVLQNLDREIFGDHRTTPYFHFCLSESVRELDGLWFFARRRPTGRGKSGPAHAATASAPSRRPKRAKSSWNRCTNC